MDGTGKIRSREREKNKEIDTRMRKMVKRTEMRSLPKLDGKGKVKREIITRLRMG